MLEKPIVNIIKGPSDRYKSLHTQELIEDLIHFVPVLKIKSKQRSRITVSYHQLFDFSESL